MKSALINLSILAVVVLVMLGLSELVLRRIVPRPNLIHPQLGNVHRPDHQGWDSAGFRNPARPERAEIVVIGDSHTVGLNAEMDEAWPQKLGGATGRSVYQMAMGGWGVVQYRYLVDGALELDPELVVVAFYVGNDLLDTQRMAYRNASWERLRDPGFEPDPDPFVLTDTLLVLQYGIERDSFRFRLLKAQERWRAKSRLYDLVDNATRAIGSKLGIATTRATALREMPDHVFEEEGLGIRFEEPGVETLLTPGYRSAMVNVERSDAGEGWRIARGLIGEIAERVEAAGVDMLVAVIPTKEMSYGLYMRQAGLEIAAPLAEYLEKESRLHDEIAAFCAERLLECVDVRWATAAALADGRRLYPQGIDGHPLAEGYAVYAEAVSRHLLEAAAPGTLPGTSPGTSPEPSPTEEAPEDSSAASEGAPTTAP